MMRRGLIGFVFAWVFVSFVPDGFSAPPVAKDIKLATADFRADDRVFYLQVRVIFGGTTGIFGTIGRELADMGTLLKQSFQYPSYELSNTIRLSLFGGEDATALVFPEHYLRVIPKGVGRDGVLRVKVELYDTQKKNDSRTRVNIGEPPNQVQYQEKENESREGSHSPVFPIASSAFALTPKQWEAFGGVPVRVNSQGRVSSNTLSSSPLSSPGVSQAVGQEKFLILGIQLSEIR